MGVSCYPNTAWLLLTNTRGPTLARPQGISRLLLCHMKRERKVGSSCSPSHKRILSSVVIQASTPHTRLLRLEELGTCGRLHRLGPDRSCACPRRSQLVLCLNFPHLFLGKELAVPASCSVNFQVTPKGHCSRGF